MTSPRIDRIRARIAPTRRGLLAHPVYDRINGIDALRLFMEHHVFAVWDFMSLLKALQRRLCCVDVPWTPPTSPMACRLINEIVLAEESDEDGHGGYASHLELYLGAMRRFGARTDRIDRFVEEIRKGRSVLRALETARVPERVRQFVARTFETIDQNDACAIASAFAFGREDLLPDVFRRIVDELAKDRRGINFPVSALLVRMVGDMPDFPLGGPKPWPLPFPIPRMS
ncbi:MAG: DUF3050 domain-containing protein, partial [Isosphaeraceae bacterium]